MRNSPIVNNAATTLAADFAACPDWQARYRLLLSIGRDLPEQTAVREAAFAVSGCEAQVWLHAQLEQGRLCLVSDSDARLIRALLHVMLEPVQQQSLAVLRGFDGLAWLQQLGLGQQLSASRSNGLQRVLEHLKQWAETGATSAATR